MVAHVLDSNLQHVRTIRMWRGEFGPAPPFDIGKDTLFCAYSAWAELTIFLTLGWKFPEHIFDSHTAFLATSNVLRPADDEGDGYKRAPKDLASACRAYGIEGWEAIDKREIASDIGNGRWHLHGREACLAYCEEDVRVTTELLRGQLRGHGFKAPANIPLILHWSNYAAKAIAPIQARGMPIDMPLWHAVQENKPAVIHNLLRRFDPSYGTDTPIYAPEGAWSYTRFERWLVSSGVAAWPRLDSGQLDTDSDAFRLMYHVPGIRELHALRDSLNVIVKAKLPIGRDGRNRPSLFPFGTATGRNAHGKSLFNAHASMRSFMVFPRNAVAVYLDWAQQEIALAAALSGDRALTAAYLTGDVYHAFALSCGLTSDTNIKHWKKTDPETRDQMKSLYLAIIFGMGVPSLAKGLNRHPLIASALIEKHKERYPRFWQWRTERALAAMLDRVTTSEFGWPLRISTSPNQRTLFNFPMQANGAECLRLAAMRLCDAGLVPSMLVHDAVLLELQDREQVKQAKEIMLAAGRDVCGIEIKVDGDDDPIGPRYRDKRGAKMWGEIVRTLQEVGAIPRGKMP
jgi:DNA polymerase-1